MFTIEYVKNLKWENQDHTLLSCVVKYEEFNEEMPCGVTPTDPYQHIQTIWQNSIDGIYGEIEEYVPPAPTTINDIPSTVIEEINSQEQSL